MNAQDVTLGVALLGFIGTLSVQLINYFSTLHTKELDAQQRQKDRDQELRKLYLVRKLEAGETVVARATAMTQHLHLVHFYYSTLNVADYNDEYNTARHKELQDERLRSNAVMVAEKNFSLLYYARLSGYDRIEEETVRHNRLLTEMMHLDNEYNPLAQEFHQTNDPIEKNRIEHAIEAVGEDMLTKMSEYLTCNVELRKLILEACDEIRRQMERYDLTQHTS